MSIAYKCNRCGSYHESCQNHKVTASGRIGLDLYDDEYDLCPECRDEFYDFINGVPAESLLDKLKARLRRKA